MSKISKISKIKQVINIWLLQRKANRLANENGIDYFIIRWNAKPEILSKDGFTLMRQNGVFPKSFTADNLKKIAVYHAKPRK